MSRRPVDTRIPRARRLRREVTEAEKLIWQNLRQPPFKQFHFRRQAPIGPYFADFASHSIRVVVELDGGQHSESQADVEHTADLAARGYRVMRYWNHDVLRNVAGVLENILMNIAAMSPPTPDPSPPQAGGGENKDA